jgi:hypothetical protein
MKATKKLKNILMKMMKWLLFLKNKLLLLNEEVEEENDEEDS